LRVANPNAVADNHDRRALGTSIDSQLNANNLAYQGVTNANIDQSVLNNDRFRNQSSYLNQDAGISNQRNDLGYGDNAARRAYMEGNTAQNYLDATNTYQNGRWGIRATNDTFNTAMGNANLTAARDSQAAASDAASRGATLSQGFGDTNANIAAQLGITSTSATNERGRAIDLANSDYASANTSNRLAYDRDNAFLNNAASNLGLDRQQTDINLQRGLAALGYDQASSLALLNQANSAAYGESAASAQAIIMQGIQMGANVGTRVAGEPAKPVAPTPTVKKAPTDKSNVEEMLRNGGV
jgi:hypothetical protein